MKNTNTTLSETLETDGKTEQCRLCEKGFPLRSGIHYGRQSLGMIPNTLCAKATTKQREAFERDERTGELVKSVEASYGIECIPCGNGTGALGTTEWGAAKEFDAAGWRVIDNEAHCPECVSSRPETSEAATVM